MKKRVKIYKPTNHFQLGGAQSAQFTPDQLVSIYMTALAEPGSSAQEAEETLRQIGVDEDTISLISDNAEEFINDQQYTNEALSRADEDELTDLAADQAAEEAAALEEQNALALAEEEARSDRMQQMYADYNEPDYSDDTDVSSQIVSRYGGVPSKKTFIKNVMKQLGGPTQEARVDSTDPDNKRKEGLSAFVKTVQEKADEDLMRKDAEAMYSMFTTPIGGDESYYEEPDMDYAQFGGMRGGRQRRMDRRMNRMLRNLPTNFFGTPGGLMIPNVYNYTDLIGAFGQGQMPADGSYYRGPKLANIDVRRTGLFGRPKEYTVTFDNDVIENPQLAEEVIKQEAKNKEEEIKDQVKAEQEGTVDQGVEEKKQAEAEAAVDINDIQVVSGSRGTGKGTTDAWGRTRDNKWYGFDPATKKWTKGTPEWAKSTTGKTATTSPKINKTTGLVEGTTYTTTDGNTKPLPNKGKQAPVKKQAPVEEKREMSPEMKEMLQKRLAKQEAYRRAMGIAGKGTSELIGRSVNPAVGNIFTNAYGLYESLPDWSQVKEVIPFMGVEGSFDYEGAQAQRRKAMGYKQQEGGMTNQASGLYMFLYGGNDPALPEVGGKLDNDDYFAEGGLTKFFLEVGTGL